MLTVDYDRLDVRAGHTVLDLGCGEGRHAFEAYRRGAHVVALDWGSDEVTTTQRWLGAIQAAGEAPVGASATAVRGDLLHLPVPTGSVDRVIASEVLEHIPDDATAFAEIARVLKPGGRVAVTVPRYGPERVCWALSDAYHANEGGHIRIYRQTEVRERLAAAGLLPGSSHHAHALHAPYWWLKCAVGVERDAAPVRAYHRLLVWDLTTRPWVTRAAEKVLDPVVGKSLVVYATKPLVTLLPEVPGVLSGAQVAATVAAIAAEQAADGMLPWWRGGQLDAWDSVEAAMALAVGGRVEEAAAALDWLCARQLAGGGFPSEWRDGAVTAPGVEANHAGYLAVGALHHALVTGTSGSRWWAPVSRALDLVTGMQLPSGAVGWALRPDGTPDDVALLTGSSSLLQALRCGLALAARVGEDRPAWAAARALEQALVERPDAFADRGRFSMDWYYPVLGGALTGARAVDRLAASWDAFVVPGLGVRCVADRPWVTGAETCELAMALAAAGQPDAATEQLAAMQHLRHDDGGYWTGYVYADDAVWPVERTTWTAAAVVLAADALAGATPGAALFTDPAFLAAEPR